MKKFILLCCLVALTGSLIGCETFKGLAQDIENTGRNIGDALKRNN